MSDREIDMLFDNTGQCFQQFKQSVDPDYEQISTDSMNEKTIIDTIKEKVDEFKEHNNLVKEPLISSNNSINALSEELSNQDVVPISDLNTDGIHIADESTNEELISSHNSDNALLDVDEPFTVNNEQIDVISNINSQKFVPS